MKKAELKEFLNDHKCEFNWADEDVILFIDFYLINEFKAFLGSMFLSNIVLRCVMKDGYLCFAMAEICEYMGIELSEVFEKD